MKIQLKRLFLAAVLVGTSLSVGCAPKTYTSAELVGINKAAVIFHSMPGGALIYDENGQALGIAQAGPGKSLQKIWQFSDTQSGKNGVVVSVTAVWASGARKTESMRITTDQPIGSWSFSRPIDAPGLNVDLAVANQTQAESVSVPQASIDTMTAATALAAFQRGWAQGRAASNRPIICTSTLNGRMVNTLC